MSMFSNPKPAASLTSGLLARKGHARPAMRPQGYLGMTASPGDELGWNDMGEDHAPVQAVQPAPVQAVQSIPEPIAPVVPIAPPPVLQQRAAIEETFSVEAAVQAEAAAPVAVSAPVALAPRPARAPQALALKSKAAFTLRLDADRHLKLRLASAVRHQSAQQLVTEALDHFLDSLTDVDALARQLGGREGRD
jgi:hypothetical protein